MRQLPLTLAIPLAIAFLLASLSLVTWRQARAREALAELDHHRRELSLLTAERGQYENRIQALESRVRVVADARARLGMRNPGAAEILYIPGSAR